MKKLLLFLFLLLSTSVLVKADNADIQKYTKACKLNDGKGCFLLGFLYYKGQGVKQNYSKAKEYYEKACVLNYGGGCGQFKFEAQQVDTDQGLRSSISIGNLYD